MLGQLRGSSRCSVMSAFSTTWRKLPSDRRTPRYSRSSAGWQIQTYFLGPKLSPSSQSEPVVQASVTARRRWTLRSHHRRKEGRGFCSSTSIITTTTDSSPGALSQLRSERPTIVFVGLRLSGAVPCLQEFRLVPGCGGRPIYCAPCSAYVRSLSPASSPGSPQ
jgi:hypothetical protein